MSNTANVESNAEKRPPRGALAVVAIGLVATFAAAFLATDESIGSAAELFWEAKAPLPDSKRVPIPGGGGMQLSEAGIRATEPNISGYRIFRVAAVLKIDAGAAVGRGRIRCTVQALSDAEIAQTPDLRASYPRSSEELIRQELPERTLVEFNSHGTDLATLPLGDAFDRFANEGGIVVEWAPYRVGRETWQWGLPSGQPSSPLELGFASFWRSTGTPAARISCTVETGAGKATVRTAGELAESGRAGS